MALRLACRRAVPKSWSICSITTESRRLYSSKHSTTFFSIETTSDIKEPSSFLEAIRKQSHIANAERHDAAVLLATPHFTKLLEDDEFMKQVVSFISDSQKMDKFHLVSAVVDHVAPPLPRNQPVKGFSILRGRLDDILPDLWTPEPPRAREDLNKVSALTFELGTPRLTVPLANTTFQNHRTSTLLASRFDVSQGSPVLEERIDKHVQRISLPIEERPQSVKDLGLWAPLVPLTHPRVVTESFGNIVRRVSVNEDSVPASMELEPAVDDLFQRRSNLAQTPMGVWAMITPPAFLPNGDGSSGTSDPDPADTFDEKHDVTSIVTSTSNRLQQLYGEGGRLYQVLSGGGGWGVKKGLLSLDPQRTHFALSEEEEMQRFIQAMDGGNFVPVGSRIQFFTSPEAHADSAITSISSSFVFGTAGTTEAASDTSTETPTDTVVLKDHFGALSNEGVFVSSAEHGAIDTMPGFNNDWKLNVPHSRILIDQE